MPFYLPPISRRRFLAGAVAAITTGGARLPLAFAEADPHTIALLADTHVAADRAVVVKDVNMAAHLAAVVEDALALGVEPDAVGAGFRQSGLRLEIEMFDALGARVRDLPITRDSLIAAMAGGE